MSFVPTLRTFRSNRHPLERALAAASTQRMRDELILAANQRAGTAPRL